MKCKIPLIFTIIGLIIFIIGLVCLSISYSELSEKSSLKDDINWFTMSNNTSITGITFMSFGIMLFIPSLIILCICYFT